MYVNLQLVVWDLDSVSSLIRWFSLHFVAQYASVGTRHEVP